MVELTMPRLRILLYVVTLTSTVLSCSASDHILFLRIAPSEARLFISNADGSGERALSQRVRSTRRHAPTLRLSHT